MPSEPPLYDARFEHDACGVGFVADTRGEQRHRVLPLALSGLAALGHRGAVAADGETSDGSGVLLPLEPPLVGLLAGGQTVRAPGVVVAFLPRDRDGQARASAVVASALAGEGLRVSGWRRVPFDRGALGRQADRARPIVRQALVARPSGWHDDRFERALVIARRRMEATARTDGLVGFSVPSASGRTVVYKGLVAGGRLADLYPDLTAALPLSHAVFHQRYATNTQPTWALAQPFRRLAHNGEINTIRGNREQVRGRAGDKVRSDVGRRLLAAGPLISPALSDSASLDEAVELLVMTGWSLDEALATLLPSVGSVSAAMSGHQDPGHRASVAPLAAWDGPAAVVFSDGCRVGAMLDRNGLRPLAFDVRDDGLVVAASEAGAFELSVSDIARRGRLGPGEMLVVEPDRGLVHLPADHRSSLRDQLGQPTTEPPADGHVTALAVPATAPPARPTDAQRRYLAGLDAERYRLDIRTMVVDGREPLWSMGDDTPTPAWARTDRPVTDHLRQAFAQVTNPPIDADRERIVMDMRVELGPRPPLLGGPIEAAETCSMRLDGPYVPMIADLVAAAPWPVRRLSASWRASAGEAGLEAALERLGQQAVAAGRGRARLIVVSDDAFSLARLPIPSVLAVGAVHTSLTAAGLRGRVDVVADVADVLDVHAGAMAIAAGASAVHPRLAIELAAETAGTRGAESLSREEAIARLMGAFEAGLRKTLARMGISTVASYVGGAQFETLELDATVVARCFPAAAAWPGGLLLEDLARTQLRRAETARMVAPETPPARLVDPGRARFRADGETHGYAPIVVQQLQRIAAATGDPVAMAPPTSGRLTVRDGLAFRRRRPVPITEVETASAVARRFVAAAMSVGALSPEAHQAITVGMQRAGGAANTGEGGEDPTWYRPGHEGERRDALIKQVASARFGVTASYLVRAEQLEIKIAQGSKPGEGGHLPGRKASATIAALRRGQVGIDYISPPPHHDIYSIEDLAQLIVDLRAVNPRARIGVKLVASRGIGTIAAGVVKSGADYVHVAGHAGGTGASPLNSIKHVGAPWELGLAEVHQTLLRGDLRDRAVLRTDGGLRVGRDIVIAALLGAEEFALGTALLVALGCDMARQCHLDTCPTGIATQRDDLRAKFQGTPELVERYVMELAEDVRRELAAIGARSVGEIVGESAAYLRAAPGRQTIDHGALVSAPRWRASAARRASPSAAGIGHIAVAASAAETELMAVARRSRPGVAHGVTLTTADRAFGARLAGAVARGDVATPVILRATGAAGQSLGAFLTEGIELVLEGTANDYVAKGLSGGTVIVRPDPRLRVAAAGQSIAGNTCLYGATAGRLHLVGRAGQRFAVRNSGAEAVVEGLGPHGCEYMTGGVVIVLGPVGPNFGAGMTGGRAYLFDPRGSHASRVDERSVSVGRLADAIARRDDAHLLVGDLRRLVVAHADAGSELARRLVAEGGPSARDVWLVEPLPATATGSQPSRTPTGVDVEGDTRVA
ncbi:MAG TPA: glutamate synthase large subunit [Candidatus Limnocylindrales bacterium]